MIAGAFGGPFFFSFPSCKRWCETSRAFCFFPARLARHSICVSAQHMFLFLCLCGLGVASSSWCVCPVVLSLMTTAVAQGGSCPAAVVASDRSRQQINPPILLLLLLLQRSCTHTYFSFPFFYESASFARPFAAHSSPGLLVVPVVSDDTEPPTHRQQPADHSFARFRLWCET